ncbi:polyphosphate kinase [Chitinophagaceae bacterium LB-8]|uniref:Polyphosphate kinase n=1 Tax=Paraflavisolibacter caeni TaxID=2982496 RepID=A0A9X2XTB8_9BACT|nr:PPK2 family polyphosphate kinase [Paraflavisolibacter caeni]MCU7547937.1 polyphosphate kinase [Paraflavisolibacter caeni]
MYLLSEISTKAPGHLDKKEIKKQTEELLEELDSLQYLLYAEAKHAVLVVLQGPDASGKDGAIRKVFGSLNPQGVRVKSFKEPTQEELSHDFLWRIHQHTPGKGLIQIFNRSHYEDVLVTRVHKLCDDETAHLRFNAINNFEEMLASTNSTQILKFYLHVSKEEQEVRLKERLEDPTKHWKYDRKDFTESNLWDQYRKMYEDVFRFCNATPWVVVPADQNWYKEFIITQTLVNALKALNMKFPSLPEKPNN